ncbi:unnamed protein product [Paramecium sonneborni]|uniref:Uncharacterized protein n=1 Tax=Paramecium sonneborni TaxID=65129 RepID=A0A8S1RKR9_9CILI|nr:unnamed protein product [Paramecium sonneborni]
MMLHLILLVVSQSGLMTQDILMDFQELVPLDFKKHKQLPSTGIFTILQVILGFEHFDSQFPTEFRITIQDFKKQVNNYLIAYRSVNNCFKILLIDDDRIQVINNFNNLLQADQTFDHQIPNVNKGVILIISFGVSDYIFYRHLITVEIIQQIYDGYKVILVVEEAFKDTQIIHHTDLHNSMIMALGKNLCEHLFLNLSHLALANSINYYLGYQDFIQAYIYTIFLSMRH